MGFSRLCFVLLGACAPTPGGPVARLPRADGDTGGADGAPSTPAVALDPAALYAPLDLLRCVVVAPGVDPAGGPVTHRFAWAVDGSPVAGAEEAADGLASTLRTPLAVGQTWTCTVTARGPGGSAPAVEARATVAELTGPLGDDLVQDGGFEDAAAAWTLADAACATVEAAGTVAPYAGAAFLWSGVREGQAEGTDCRARQDIDLLAAGYPAGAVDAGVLRVEGEAALGERLGAPAFDDLVRLRVWFLDAAGAVLGAAETLPGASEGWAVRPLQAALPPGTRTLRVEVDGTFRQGVLNDGRADAVAVRVEAGTPVSPNLTLLPMLQDPRGDAMRLLWESDGALVPPGVRYGPAGEPLARAAAWVTTRQLDDTHFVHVAELADLEPGAAYDYQVFVGQTASPSYAFHTAPPAGSPVTLAWAGDNHSGFDVFAAHAEHMAAARPDLFLSVGDVVNTAMGMWEGEIHDWGMDWFGPLETADFAQTVPVLIARGNHDAHHLGAEAYTALPGNGAWYAFPYGAAFVVVLDSQASGLEQTTFLEEQLASPEARAAAWRIVAFHQPPYTNAVKVDGSGQINNGGDGNAFARDNWVPVFEALDVDVVVAGHFHSYQRAETGGVHYLVVGGAGALFDTVLAEPWDFFQVAAHTWHYALMRVDADRLVWTAYDLDDQPFDELVLERGGG